MAATAVMGEQLLFPKELQAVRIPAKWDREADVVGMQAWLLRLKHSMRAAA